MKIDKPEYKDIRHMVEDVTGVNMKTPKDFDLLVQSIFDRTHVLLSTSTLKRFWGYVAKNDEARGEMRQTNLDILARYVGFTNWEAFCNRNKAADKDTSSLFYGHKQISTESLSPGDTLTIMWQPNRQASLLYQDNDTFLVTACENCKLMVGDTFQCHTFVENQPLVVINLKREGQPPCGYTCGKTGGIKIL